MSSIATIKSNLLLSIEGRVQRVGKMLVLLLAHHFDDAKINGREWTEGKKSSEDGLLPFGICSNFEKNGRKSLPKDGGDLAEKRGK